MIEVALISFKGACCVQAEVRSAWTAHQGSEVVLNHLRSCSTAACSILQAAVVSESSLGHPSAAEAARHPADSDAWLSDVFMPSAVAAAPLVAAEDIGKTLAAADAAACAAVTEAAGDADAAGAVSQAGASGNAQRSSYDRIDLTLKDGRFTSFFPDQTF